MSEKQFNLDTVEHAAATPDTELPWAELGLKENEFEDIKEILAAAPPRLSWQCTRSCGPSTAPTSLLRFI